MWSSGTCQMCPGTELGADETVVNWTLLHKELMICWAVRITLELQLDSNTMAHVLEYTG